MYVCAHATRQDEAHALFHHPTPFKPQKVTIYEARDGLTTRVQESYPIGLNPRGVEALDRVNPDLALGIRQRGAMVDAWKVYAGKLSRRRGRSADGRWNMDVASQPTIHSIYRAEAGGGGALGAGDRHHALHHHAGGTALFSFRVSMAHVRAAWFIGME